jgi:hypothetical protein
MTIEELKKSNGIIFECISGSRAYGLQTPTSDTDIRGVFILPKEQFYSLDYVDQVNNESNDIVYYEFRKFMELLSKNNPNILELLNVPEECVLYKHPLFDLLKPELFLSRLCEKSFVNYAYSQIKKARGLNKKIVNPVDKERKSVLDFCQVYQNKTSQPLKGFLEANQIRQEDCGLAAIPHIKNCYNLFWSPAIEYSGIQRKVDANEISLSSIPKGETPLGLLFFNLEAYSMYCKDYKEYWEWVNKRNDTRYQTTVEHGKNYDSKNVMHTMRLLQMAKEIAVSGEIKVKRDDREYLLDIKNGKFEYDDLLEKAEKQQNELSVLFEKSKLPQVPDINRVNRLLFYIRSRFYLEYQVSA